MIRLGIVDDDPMVRTGLAFILGGEDDIEVAWQAGDGAEALEALGREPVDVVLLDIRMPVLDGLATLTALADWPRRPKVIVLTTFNTDDYVLRALKLGADGFLLKDADPARLVEAIERVAGGETALSPEVTSTLIHAATESPAVDATARDAFASLTNREREVAELMAQGLTNAQIATRLHVSLASVKAHLASVFTKFGVDNRVSAAMVVRDAGGAQG